MKTYELTLVLPEKATETKKKSLTAMIEKLASTYKGKVVRTEDWGVKELSYTIKKNNSGNFLHFVLELTSEGAQALKDKMRLEDSVIRQLFITA